MPFFFYFFSIIGAISLLIFLFLFYIQINDKLKTVVTPITLFIGGISMLIVGLIEQQHYNPQTQFVSYGLIMSLVGAIWYIFYKIAEKEGVFEREKEKERLEIERERERAIASQNQSEPWAVKYMTSPCPHCGHYKVRWAKWEDKQMSVAFWGGASSKLGTNYKCEHCGRMWE